MSLKPRNVGQPAAATGWGPTAGPCNLGLHHRRAARSPAAHASSSVSSSCQHNLLRGPGWLPGERLGPSLGSHATLPHALLQPTFARAATRHDVYTLRQLTICASTGGQQQGSSEGPSGVAAAASGAVGAPTQPAKQAVRYSPLHHNVEEFCVRVVPTEEERKYKQLVIDLVRAHTRRAMQEAGRHCEVHVFGSFATGLSTWSSDVDILVTGVMEPDKITGVYDISDRGRVVGRLRRIGEAIRRCKKLDNPRISIVARARIPIIKLRVRNVNVDISLSDSSALRVAKYMAQQVRKHPSMRPLVLVLKAYLRSTGLNEVMYGGLSSYSLCNMVVAHLQEEIKAGRDVSDLGEALYSFLLRYGEDFDYGYEAVSIESGGVVPKHALGMAALSSSRHHQYGGDLERLTVDCPVTGRDVSNGTYRIDAVRSAFQRAARRLEALARGRRVDDLSVNYLQALFDVQRAVKRSNLDALDYQGPYGGNMVAYTGKGTSPDIIQIGRADWDEEVEEEFLEGYSDGDDERGAGVGQPPLDAMWAGLDSTSTDQHSNDDDDDDDLLNVLAATPAPSGPRGSRGNDRRGGGRRGGARGR